MRHDPLWYRRFLHTLDTGEGVESEEDLFTPCELEHDLPPGATVFLSVGLEAPASSPATIMESERRRRMALTLPGLAGDATANILARAAEAFIVEEPSKRARLVTAYPDTAEDLRAAMIALPGLLLATRRLDAARTVLLDAAERLSARADGADDAALWFMRACELYGDHSRDWPLVRDSLVPACAALAERYAAHRDGAGFALAPDGLLCSAAAEGGLTWMDDAARAGKPVEVNALWRNALGWLARWSDRRGEADTARRFSDLHDLSGRAFRHRFWDESAARLRDTVDGPAADAAIRPNQVFALVLGGDLLDRRQATTILGQVEMRLLTAHGLRTLSLEDLGFVAEVAGPAAARAGRHSGAAYPWLIGPHVDAILRVHGRTVRAYARTEVCMQGLIQEQLQQGCLGQIPEMFDGAAPHAPHGAFAHAPAVGELLRAYAEVRGRLL